MVNKYSNYGGLLTAARTFVLMLCLLPIGQVVRAATTIDIMLVYDNSASAWVASNGGMATFSQDVVTRLNQAMQNSGIDANFRLVHAMAVDYDTTSGPRSPLGDDLDALSGGAGVFADVHHARDTYGADLVGMLVDHGSAYGYVGVGWVLSNWSGSPNYAYTVNAIQAVALNHTLTHEMGHNFGADHSKYQTSDPGPNMYLDGEYSAGWYFTGTNGVDYHTIMAYDDSDNDGRPDYTEAPLFSTPSENYQGTAAGDATNGDNARLIGETKDVVAAYRAAVIDPDPVDPDPVDPDLLPDLIATSVTSSATAIPGGEIQVTASASNPGNATAGSTWLGYYLSTDSAISLSDTNIGWGCVIGELPPGGTDVPCSDSITLPDDITPGIYYFGAYADADQEVPESDETNNGLAALSPITISAVESGEFMLDVASIGLGEISSVPAGIDCAIDCQTSFLAGTRVTLTATPDAGTEFIGWGGDCAEQGTATTCSLDMDADRFVAAAFGGGITRAETTAWSVAEIYMATLGYAPDNEGLQYWIENIDTLPQWTQETVAGSFFDQPLVQQVYPPEAGYGAFIDALYRNLFGRGADQQGYDYWLTQLESGQIARQHMLIAMINGGWANPSPDAIADMQRFGLRIQVALAFAEYQADNNIVYSELSEAYQQYLREVGRDMLLDVTVDETTRDAAIANIPIVLAGLSASK
ncbi:MULTISPECIES: M12 family metallo-peptidase [Thiorhodovibrio]|uniref:M12 family metallo-peptidase n=1 Tax=Thiorhodovibrio TaxID=61593 RepID=UPI0019148036|nr:MULTISPECIES: DUF4214 domain-containing protein [Thiorhodovibrio]MBK5969015.1 hypothetical protein [Thiorhodovibrio winogradskyi]WPL15105.1 hypothetical protein Thiosp_04969 [Thiorhodovibrio litoralis]